MNVLPYRKKKVKEACCIKPFECSGREKRKQCIYRLTMTSIIAGTIGGSLASRLRPIFSSFLWIFFTPPLIRHFIFTWATVTVSGETMFSITIISCMYLSIYLVFTPVESCWKVVPSSSLDLRHYYFIFSLFLALDVKASLLQHHHCFLHFTWR